MPGSKNRYATTVTDFPQERVAVEFRVENERYPFVEASDVESCTFELEEMIPRGDGVYSEFFRVQGADTDRIMELAAETPQVEPTLLSADGDEALFEFEVAGGCIAVSLAEAGAYPETVRGEDGDGSVVAEFPDEDARSTIRDLLDDHDGVDVVSEDADGSDGPRVAESAFLDAVHEALTTRQRAALMTALSEGFYDWPKAATLEDVAATLGTDVETLDVRLHNCEQLVLAALFEAGVLEERSEPVHPFSDSPTAVTE